MLRRVDSARYRLRLHRPLPGAATYTEYREGLVVAMYDCDGHVGYGEVAPLPGWHRESLDDAEKGLGAASDALLGSAGDNFENVTAALVGTAPSVMFGLEMAWLGLQARRLDCTPADVLCTQPLESVAVNGLCSSGIDNARLALQEGRLRSYPTLKVKVGQRPLDEERATLTAFVDQLPTTKLRLDGNRTLTVDDAEQLVAGLPRDRIDYFEEPLHNPDDLPDLANRTGIGIALDETLRESDSAIKTAPWVVAWVVKPTLQNGFAGTLAQAQQAYAAGIACVVSSCFESGLGLSALAQLAACLAQPDAVANPAVGLATDAWLASDLVDPPFCSTPGLLHTNDWTGVPSAAALHDLDLSPTTTR